MNARDSQTKLSRVDDVLFRARQSPDRFYDRRCALHCILGARDWEMMAFVFACAVGHLILGVY
jgi:hypothetical protein